MARSENSSYLSGGRRPLSKFDEFSDLAIHYTIHSHPSKIPIYQKTRHLLGARPAGPRGSETSITIIGYAALVSTCDQHTIVTIIGYAGLDL